MAALAATLRHPEFLPLALRSFGIALAGFLALSAGAFFWLDSRGDSAAIEIAYKRLPSAVVSLESPGKAEASEAVQNPSEPPPPPQLEPVEKPAAAPSSGLAPAPIEGLFEAAGDGFLPKVRESDGLSPFRAYRAPLSAPVEGPKIAVAVLDIGLSETATQAALAALPPEATLVFSPYGQALDLLQQKAREKGHEIWLSLPLESSAVPSPDPGAQAIYLNAGIERNGARLLWTLGRAVGYAGVAAVTSSPLMNSESQTPWLLGPIFSRGLGLADLSPKPATRAAAEAKKVNAPYVAGAVAADSSPDKASIREKLDSAVDKALKGGAVIVAIRPYPSSLAEVRGWSAELDSKGVTLVPLSALAEKP